MKQVILHINGMRCIGCMNTIKRIIQSQDGVEQVEVQLTPGKVTFIAPENVSTTELKSLIEEQSPYKVVSIDEYGINLDE